MKTATYLPWHTIARFATCLSLFFVALNATRLAAQNPLTPALDSMIQALEMPKPPDSQAILLNDIAFKLIEMDANKCEEYASQALAFATEHNLPEQVARAHNNLGSYHVNISNYEKAEEHYKLCMAYHEKTGNDRWVANILGNLGYLHYFRGNFPLALDYSFQSLKIFEKIGYKMGMANEMSGIGSIYMDQGDFDKAVFYDTLSLALYRELNDKGGEALVLGNLANIYSEMGQRERAISHYQSAVDIYLELGNLVGLGRNLINLGVLFNDELNYVRSKETFEEALRVFREINYPHGISYAFGNLGVTYFLNYKNLGRTDSNFIWIPTPKNESARLAILYLKQAVEMAQQASELALVNKFSQNLAEVYDRLGDLPNAYRYFKMHASAKDSIHSIESKTAIEKLTTEREVELKNKQIELDRLAVQLKRNERAYFFIGMGLLLLSMLFIYRNYANQKKSNVELASLNHRIADTNQQLEGKNTALSNTLQHLKMTQEQLILAEKAKENALIRSRISQDIHDDISSGLTKISWLAEAVAAKAAHQGLAPDVSVLEKINRFSKETVAKLGEIIWSSNPDSDNLPSLLGYMRNHIRQYMEDTAIRPRILFPDQLPETNISPELRRNLFLVMKEALHNAVKYSQATEIAISFALVGNDTYRLSVADNGLGMEEGVVQGTGNGLLNMRRRMAAVGGNMSINTAPGKGTEVVFEGRLY